MNNYIQGENFSPNNSIQSKEINKIIEKKYSGPRPGISIMAVKKGTVVYNKQSGLANLEYDIPITLNTVFNLASITKQFTAMAILQLIEGGLLKYEREITDFFPELFKYSGVTVRQLLNHTSGIENYYRIYDRLSKSTVNASNHEVYELLQKEQKLQFHPGTRFEYSNSNYVLLALLIEKVSGITLADYMERNIFNILGMKISTVFHEKQPIIKNRAYGYKMVGALTYCDYSDALTTGDGGLFSTLEDLYLWDQALYTEKLVSKESINLAFTKGLENSVEQYGFGWSIEVNADNKKKVWHSGSDAGFRSAITRFVDDEFTVIILSNSAECTWQERQLITGELFDLFVRI